MPVLPATRTPGIAAAAPVPTSTTASMYSRTVRAVVARSTRLRAGAARPARSVSGVRTPSSRDRRRDPRHLQRRRLHAPLADRRRADGELVADLVGRRDRARRRAGDAEVLVEAERLGRLRRAAPGPGARRAARRPSCTSARRTGAATRRTTRRWRSRARRPRASPPSATGIGRVAAREARLERAGERDHLERRARAAAGRRTRCRRAPRISPVFGLQRRRRRRTASPSASTAARCTSGSIDVRTALPARRWLAPRTRVPARSTPPGLAAQLVVEDALEAREADRRVGGHARARAARRRAPAGTGPSWPAIAVATGPERGGALGRPRRAACRRARGCSRAARQLVVRVRRSPRSTPGNVRFCAQSTRASSSSPSKRQAQRRADRAEDARRDGHRDAHDAVSSLPALPGANAVAVAVAAAAR